MAHVWIVLKKNVLCPKTDPEIKIFSSKEKASEYCRRYFRECLSDLINLYEDIYKDWTSCETEYVDFIEFNLRVQTRVKAQNVHEWRIYERDLIDS